jgi:aminodeoxyfutalosine synthase
MLDHFDHIKAYLFMLGKATAQTALHFGAGGLDLRLTDGGELTHSYSVERDTVYNSVAAV